MKNTKSTLNILQKLIAIPSYVDNKNNEREIGLWIYDFLKANTRLTVIKHFCTKNRFNVIATNSPKPTILVTGHIDTVRPNSSWRLNPFSPKVVNDKLYGLGSTDMKSGLAVMLSLACNNNLVDNVMFLFYCDEEYDFLGMQKFIANYKTTLKPKFIISLDGDDLKIGNSCRGLIEINVKVRGKTGHSANPKNGINAILASQDVINNLRFWLQSFSSSELGNSTLNVAYFRGGTKIGLKGNTILLGKEGNIIADFCEYVLEIRVASGKLGASLVKSFIEKESRKLGLNIDSVKIRHDLGSWTTSPLDLKKLLPSSTANGLVDAKKRGYSDIQMLWQAFNKVPALAFGCGEKNMSHKPDEFVRISSVKKLQAFYAKFLLK